MSTLSSSSLIATEKDRDRDGELQEAAGWAWRQRRDGVVARHERGANRSACDVGNLNYGDGGLGRGALCCVGQATKAGNVGDQVMEATMLRWEAKLRASKDRGGIDDAHVRRNLIVSPVAMNHCGEA